MMLTIKTILVIVIASNLFLLLSIYRRNFNLANIALSLYVIGIIGWTTFIVINLSFENMIAVRFIFAFGAIVMAAQTWFAQIFPTAHKKTKLILYWPLVVGAMFFLASFLPGALFNKIKVNPGGYTEIDNGFLTPFYSIYCLSFILCCIIILYVKSRNKEYNVIVRKQLKFLFFGYLFFSLGAFLTNVLFSHYLKIYAFNSLGPVWSLVLVSFIFFIINRYRFLGIKTILQRSLIFTLLLVFVVSVYLLFVFLLGLIMHNETTASFFISAGLTSIVGIFGVPQIEKFFRHATDRIFFKKKYNYSNALHELSRILSVNLNLFDLCQDLDVKLQNILKVNKVMIILKKQETVYKDGHLQPCPPDCLIDVLDDLKNSQGLILNSEILYLIEKIEKDPGYAHALERVKKFGVKYGIELTIPLFLENDSIGVLLLGAKRSEESFTTEDLHLIQTLSFQLAVALEKSRLYESEKNYARTLEEKVAQRTEKIQQLQEEQRQMMLDISHGLQTPLTVLRGELESLQIKLPEDTKLSNFERSIDQISKFIYDMLNLARLETTTESFQKDELNFSEILNDIVEYLDVLAQEKGITIFKNIQENIKVMGRKDKLEEMITNIISNSIKYISNDKKININLEKVNGQAVLTMTDTGIGISKENLAKLFSRFYRIKNPDGTKIAGTGLGLAITKKIVLKHNGTINIESIEGKGTTVKISLQAV